VKALLLSNLFPSAGEPTRGVFNLQRFTALASHCDVRVVSPLPWWVRTKTPASLLSVPRDRAFGLEAYYPTYWSMPGKAVMHGRAMYRSLRGFVRRLHGEFPFDVILAAWAYPDGFAAASLAHDLKLPLVTMVLGSDINELVHRPDLREQIRWTLDQSARVVAVSDALKQGVMDLGIAGDRIIVQRNGVDGERFHLRDKTEMHRKLGLPLNRGIICYVGNFSPEKGIADLIEAMGLVRDRGNLELNVIGDGAMADQLRSRVAELKIEDRVHFHGRRPHAEIPEWLAAADVLCLPSHREGCPNVVLEALASGRPVVASRVGGVPELLNDENGIMVPPGDPTALAEALTQAVTRNWDPAALRASVDCLSWEQYGRTLRDALDAALVQKPRLAVP